jgi:hypothetical protein
MGGDPDIFLAEKTGYFSDSRPPEPIATLPPFGPIEGQKWFENPVFTSLHLKSPVHVVPPL